MILMNLGLIWRIIFALNYFHHSLTFLSQVGATWGYTTTTPAQLKKQYRYMTQVLHQGELHQTYQGV
jgi:hypothetical protein